MLTNVKNPVFHNVKKMKKMTRNPPADSDHHHHQKLITSRGSPLARVCQVWSAFVSAFVGYRVYRMADGIQIRIFWLIRIRMSVGAVPKYRGCLNLVSVSHFAKYGTKRPLIVWEMLTNVRKSHIPQWWKQEAQLSQRDRATPCHWKFCKVTRDHSKWHCWVGRV